MKGKEQMKLKAKSLVSQLAMVSLLTGSLIGMSAAAANAAPAEATIRLVTPVLDASNTSEPAAMQKMADQWVANTWFGSGLMYQRAWAPVGSTVSLTYLVTGTDGKPLANTDVSLRLGMPYSNSNAIVQVDNVTTTGVDKPPMNQGLVTHKTGADGKVTFDLKSLDPAANGEAQPANWNDPVPADLLNELYTQILPQVTGQATDHATMSEFHFYTPGKAPGASNGGGTPAPAASGPSIRLTSPMLNDSNSIHRADLEDLFSVQNKWYAKGIGFHQVYAQAGSTIDLTYQAKDENGKVLANTPVKLHVNKAYSNSTAHVTDGKTPTDPTAAQGSDQALWTANTDANGYVTFHLTNTDATGEATPATATTPVPTSGTLVFSQLYPEIKGQDVDIADMIEIHFYGKAPVLSATASYKKAVKKGKSSYTMTVVVGGAMSKVATIGITGLKPMTKAIADDPATFTFAVTPGAKTVSVTVDGKVVTSKVTVKK
jgi:hypothetical protein